MKNLIIIGAGGMGRETAFIIERINERENKWNLLGFFDENEALIGKTVNGYPVYSQIEELESFEEIFYVCAIGSSFTRRRVVERLIKKYKDLKFATLIDPSVILSDSVEIGEGSIIAEGAILTVNICLGKHSLINMGVTIGHDNHLSDFVTLYPGVHVSGNCVLNEGVEMGSGSVIIQGLSIGKQTIVGAGAVVVKDLPSNATAVGCPAKVIKQRAEE